MNVVSKTVATVRHPTIEAVVNTLFRFDSLAQARKRLEAIHTHFIVSKDQDEDPEQPTLRLWIKGFDLTEAELEQGYVGNFATLACVEIEPGVYTIGAYKIEVPLANHPQKKRPKQRHPDWGHPILRQLKKNPVFPTIEEAQQTLQRLHQDFPEVSIPCTNKMYIMIYGKEHAPPPVQKWILTVQTADQGGFRIHYEINANPKKRKNAEPAPEAGAEGAEGGEGGPPGYFASLVQLKRSNKKRSSPLEEAAKRGAGGEEAPEEGSDGEE